MQRVPSAVLAVLSGCLLVLGGVAARRWLRVVVIEGSSMAPAYADGDRILAAYGLRLRPIRRGDVVVVRAPNPDWRGDDAYDAAHRSVVKRVTAVGGEPRPDGGGTVPADRLFVEGDAPGGYDSHVFGPLPRTEVLGRVLVRLVHGQSPSLRQAVPIDKPSLV